MSRECERFEAMLTEGADGRMPAELEGHAAVCTRCRDLLAVHRSLSDAFAGQPVPRLSAGFEARLERRLSEEGRRASGRLSGLVPAAWVYRLYWMLAAVGSYLVLRTVELPATVSPVALGVVLGAGLMTAAGLALPGWALLRTRRRVPLPGLPE